MPTLNWIGKDKVVNHHLDVPYRNLEEQYRYGHPEAAGENKIIHGDNLEALKSLLPEYEGKIKCIYIDPPYNTGEEQWIYNDNVNHPKIKQWLGEVVGREREDLTRHDKWLCMLYPRLKLLRRLLTDDGAIFVSIDDTEVSTLRGAMDEVFGRSNWVATFIWEKRTTRENRRVFSFNHDYLVCFARNKPVFETVRGDLPLTEEVRERYSNPDNDPRGPWQSVSMNAQAGHATKDQFYRINTPSGRKLDPPPGRCWIVTKPRFHELVADNRIWFGNDGSNVPRLKKFLSETDRGLTPHTLWKAEEVGTTDSATKALNSLFDGNNVFPTPKSIPLIERVLRIAMQPGDIVLDSFAGSGTTAHAVLNLNKEDGGNRKFILVELEDYADSITAERVKRVIDGYGEGKNAVEGTGGGFTFHELGEPLFYPDGSINDSLGIDHLRQYIWFTETRSAVPATTETKNPQFIGSQDGTSYYLHHQSDGLGTLDFEFLKTIDKKDEQYVIYADRCHVDEELLRRHGVIFKKVPRDIVRF